jgi:predicted secreted protein
MVGATAMRRAYPVLLGLLLVAQACSSLPIAGSDRDLTVSEGSAFQVVLVGQSGTGYSWTVDGAEAGTVELVRASKERTEGVPGAREQQTFVFLAKRSGTVTLHFSYARPWVEKPSPLSRSYRVQVVRC